MVPILLTKFVVLFNAPLAMELHSGHLVTILKVSNKSGQKALLHSYFHLCNFVLLKYRIDRLAEFFKRRKKAI